MNIIPSFLVHHHLGLLRLSSYYSKKNSTVIRKESEKSTFSLEELEETYATGNEQSLLSGGDWVQQRGKFSNGGIGIRRRNRRRRIRSFSLPTGYYSFDSMSLEC